MGEALAHLSTRLALPDLRPVHWVHLEVPTL